MRKIFSHTYNDIISVENLLLAWQEFERGKSKKLDVMEFKRQLMNNIFSLHNDLKNKINREITDSDSNSNMNPNEIYQYKNNENLEIKNIYKF